MCVKLSSGNRPLWLAPMRAFPVNQETRLTEAVQTTPEIMLVKDH